MKEKLLTGKLHCFSEQGMEGGQLNHTSSKFEGKVIKLASPTFGLQNGRAVVDKNSITRKGVTSNSEMLVNGSWYNFYDKYIAPSILDKIVFNSVVNSINYSEEKISVSTSQGLKSADKVIVSVPLKILQAGDIEFIPGLSENKQSIIKNALIWDGFKAFFEFSNSFYDSGFEKIIENSKAGQKFFYDASFGQASTKNIIGLFAVGNTVDQYNALSKNQLMNVILKELDNLFSNQATTYYKKHISQNWNKEPFIRGGYLTDHANWQEVKD